MEWNFDMDAAPRGRIIKTVKRIGKHDKEVPKFVKDLVLLACDGSVVLSYWIPDQSRWCMLSTKNEPIAWMPYPEYPEAL